MPCWKRSITRMPRGFFRNLKECAEMNQSYEIALPEGLRKSGAIRKKALAAGLSLAAMLLLSFAGCQNKKPATRKSAIDVLTSAQGIMVRTPSAEFILSPGGGLKAGLRKNDRILTLDNRFIDTAQIVAPEKNEFLNAALRTGDAEVGDTSGKLGDLGKRIDVTGEITGSGLEETLTLEVYDAFPNLALLSLRLVNRSPRDILLKSVDLQQHSFVSPEVASGTSQSLWTFEGASLHWGKDEILPVPAKFAQENPFGAPVAVKDDLGHVGGGIPVVAFWSRTVGEAIGHVETLPLVLSIPVQTTKDGGVETGVSIHANTVLKPGEVF